MKYRGFSVKIITENDAFQDGNRNHEIGRLLRKIANTIEEGGPINDILLDINGNKVGRYALMAIYV